MGIPEKFARYLITISRFAYYCGILIRSDQKFIHATFNLEFREFLNNFHDCLLPYESWHTVTAVWSDHFLKSYSPCWFRIFHKRQLNQNNVQVEWHVYLQTVVSVGDQTHCVSLVNTKQITSYIHQILTCFHSNKKN